MHDEGMENDFEKALNFFGLSTARQEQLKKTGPFLGAIILILTLVTCFLILLFFGAFVWKVFAGDFFTDNIGENFRNFIWGASVLFGAPFVIWRVIIAAQQARVAEQNHFTDLYVKAVEQLGANYERKVLNEDSDREVTHYEPNIAVRLGGLYALERLAKDSEKDFETIINLLCAYVRKESWRDKDRNDLDILRPLHNSLYRF
jgi:hypothetical protein